jgi:hypothetical protein
MTTTQEEEHAFVRSGLEVLAKHQSNTEFLTGRVNELREALVLEKQRTHSLEADLAQCRAERDHYMFQVASFSEVFNNVSALAHHLAETLCSKQREAIRAPYRNGNGEDLPAVVRKGPVTPEETGRLVAGKLGLRALESISEGGIVDSENESANA